jgi:hypothetical protein
MEQRQVDLILLVAPQPLLDLQYLKGNRDEQVLRRHSPPARNIFNPGLRRQRK